jgi:two-component system nitrate/nitrite response regulator NarL
MGPAKLWLADSNRLLREGLKGMLPKQFFEVVGESNSLTEALAWFKAGGTPVSLVICDPADDFCQELDVAATIIRDFGAPKIIVLTRRLTEPRFELALKSGVSGFLSKDIAPEALLPSLRVVLLGGQVFAPHRLTCKLQPMRMEPVAPTTPDIVAMAATMPTASGDEASSESAVGLSEREAQIVRCLVDGLANKQIARNLNIAEATVKVHLKALLRKVKARNRTQAAIWAINNRPAIGSRPAAAQSEVATRAVTGGDDAPAHRVGDDSLAFPV